MHVEMDMKKVLFFKPGAIGDLLHTLPALKALKRKFPAAQVTVVVSPGLESLIQGTPLADRVLVFDKTKFKKSPLDFIKFGSGLRTERYDLFVDMQPSLRSLLLRKLSNSKVQLVYRKQVKGRTGDHRIHAAQNFMETLGPLGINEPVEDIELPLAPDAVMAVEQLFSERNIDLSRPLIALNCSVGAARPARNWIPERFTILADRIIDELGATVVFVGGKEDQDLVKRVMGTMKTKAVSFAGELSLELSAALLSKCRCLVSSDTGPLHLATAVKIPVIGLFGSTDPQRTGPIGKGHQVLSKSLPCVPCEEKRCPLGTLECMAAISVDDVFAAVSQMLGDR